MRARENPRTRIMKEVIPTHLGSPEMQANGKYEVLFRSWVADQITRHGHITVKDAIAGGAEYTGGSQSTMSRYLGKLTSIEGHLAETSDILGTRVVVSRSTVESDDLTEMDHLEPNGHHVNGDGPGSGQNGHHAKEQARDWHGRFRATKLP